MMNADHLEGSEDVCRLLELLGQCAALARRIEDGRMQEIESLLIVARSQVEQAACRKARRRR